MSLGLISRKPERRTEYMSRPSTLPPEFRSSVNPSRFKVKPAARNANVSPTGTLTMNCERSVS